VPTASAGFTSLIVERVIDTDPLSVTVHYTERADLDGGSTINEGDLPVFRGTVQRRADPGVKVDIGPGEGASEQSDEYVLMASKTADLGEVTPDRVLTFDHPAYGTLRITNVHAYRVSGETCGYVCRLVQVR
jgi:hypothetical protein